LRTHRVSAANTYTLESSRNLNFSNNHNNNIPANLAVIGIIKPPGNQSKKICKILNLPIPEYKAYRVSSNQL